MKTAHPAPEVPQYDFRGEGGVYGLAASFYANDYMVGGQALTSEGIEQVVDDAMRVAAEFGEEAQDPQVRREQLIKFLRVAQHEIFANLLRPVD